MKKMTVSDIKFMQRQQLKEKPDETKLGFGQHFTDYMFVMEWTPESGWHNPMIKPYGPMNFDPAMSVLHYGQAIFEGMKAYYVNGQIRLFRPQLNFERLNQSAERMALPKIDEDFALEALYKLLEIEKTWVPHSEGTSLYIRPFMFAAEDTLGVHAATRVIYSVILSPSGSYFNGLTPTKIYVEDEYVRAVRGGVGFAKTAGNYAASLKGQQKANQLGYAQSLWLDGVEQKYVEEGGAMNIFFKVKDKFITPELNGSILPGITRRSVIELLRSQGQEVEERKIPIDEIYQYARSGELQEVFCTGTAAVVSPIGELGTKTDKYIINEGQTGSATKKLYNDLTNIQYGKVEDKNNWSIVVCEV